MIDPNRMEIMLLLIMSEYRLAIPSAIGTGRFNQLAADDRAVVVVVCARKDRCRGGNQVVGLVTKDGNSSGADESNASDEEAVFDEGGARLVLEKLIHCNDVFDRSRKPRSEGFLEGSAGQERYVPIKLKFSRLRSKPMP